MRCRSRRKERLRIAEMMWNPVSADGQASELEDNVVWRAADLLGVSSRDRIDLKRRVRREAGEPVGWSRCCGRGTTTGDWRAGWFASYGR